MITGFITAIGSAISAVFNWVTNRSILNNSPEMKANKLSEIDQKSHENHIEIVQKADIDSVRRDASS